MVIIFFIQALINGTVMNGRGKELMYLCSIEPEIAENSF
jgi:hypothetical protein